MRRFVVVGHRAATSDDFTLEDLAGGAGRMDIMARCVSQGLLISHGVREDSEVCLVLTGPPDPPKVVRFAGGEVRNLHPDERSIAALIRRALSRPAGVREASASRGVFVSRGGLAEVLRRNSGPIVQMDESGEDFEAAGDLSADATFVLSDSEDFAPEEEGVLSRLATWKVCLGPISLHADQCITIIHNRLDRARASKNTLK